MKPILIIVAALGMSGAALAQQSSTGQSSGGPAVQRSGPATTGSIVIPAEKRSLIRQRFVAPPVTTLRERVVVGATVPAEVELAPIPETVMTEVPDFRTYRYFRWNDDVVLVDPGSRQVVQI